MVYDPYFTESSEFAQNSFAERWFLGGSSHGSGWGSSPAISALGLLAFLFFLNLIQTSLATSRWLALGITGSTIPINNPGIITATGRSLDFNNTISTSPSDFAEVDRIERVRQKRSSDMANLAYRITPEFISTHSIGHKLNTSIFVRSESGTVAVQSLQEKEKETLANKNDTKNKSSQKINPVRNRRICEIR